MPPPKPVYEVATSTPKQRSHVPRKVHMEVAWSKIVGRFCSHHLGIYDSAGVAQTACSKSPTCTGVYDKDCDGAGKFMTCDSTALAISSKGSCVYANPQVALPNATAPRFIKLPKLPQQLVLPTVPPTLRLKIPAPVPTPAP